MPGLAIIGAQWGDEGKGKITDYLGEDADMIVRFQGGNNAGHTIVVDGKVFKLHGLPSGVVRPGKLAVIGNGVVVNLEELAEEIEQVKQAGGNIDGLRISDRAHLIMNYHKKLDGAEEKYRGKNVVGTTKKGIGPAYQDKIARIGFRAGDLLDDDLLKEKISFILPYKKDLMAMMGAEPCQCTTESLHAKMMGWRDMVGDCICDTSVLINDSLDEGRNVIFEGAQGAMLDIDHGTYPYVTSSATCGGGVCTGSGVAPNRIDRMLGVVKARSSPSSMPRPRRGCRPREASSESPPAAEGAADGWTSSSWSTPRGCADSHPSSLPRSTSSTMSKSSPSASHTRSTARRSGTSPDPSPS